MQIVQVYVYGMWIRGFYRVDSGHRKPILNLSRHHQSGDLCNRKIMQALHLIICCLLLLRRAQTGQININAGPEGGRIGSRTAQAAQVLGPGYVAGLLAQLYTRLHHQARHVALLPNLLWLTFEITVEILTNPDCL